MQRPDLAQAMSLPQVPQTAYSADHTMPPQHSQLGTSSSVSQMNTQAANQAALERNAAAERHAALKMEHEASIEHGQKQDAYRSFIEYAASTLASAYVKVRNHARFTAIVKPMLTH